MPRVPLVPLPSNVVTGTGEIGFDAPPGLAKGIPSEWVPGAERVRISSFPTPFAIEEATLLLLSKADLGQQAEDHELVAASKLLLDGLLSGVFRLRWVAIDRLDAGALQQALDVFLGADTLKRLGLIVDEKGVVWGYIGRENVPCLAGAKERDLPGLRKLLDEGHCARDVLHGLVDALRGPLRARGRWDPAIPWMRLFDLLAGGDGAQPVPDLLLAGGASAQRVPDLAPDVRSIGPFRVQVGRLPDDSSAPQLDLYWLGYSKDFVPRLASALAGSVKPASGQDASPDSLVFSKGKPLAQFGRYTGSAVPAFYLGEGNAEFLIDPLPPDAPSLATLPQSADLRELFKDHVDRVRKNAMAAQGQRWRSLVECQEEAQYLLSDVARVILVYAPEIVGESSPLAFSAAYRRFSANQPRPTAIQLAALVKEGKAFLLPPKASAGRLHAAVFVEDGERGGAPVPHAVADLSRLGLALWLVYGGVEYAEGFYWDPHSGERLFDTGNIDFPLELASGVDEWWTRESEQKNSRLRLATLQRFLASYELPRERADEYVPLRQLQALAAERFVCRLLGRADAPQYLRACQAGTGGSHVPEEKAVILSDYGDMKLVRDPYAVQQAGSRR